MVSGLTKWFTFQVEADKKPVIIIFTNHGSQEVGNRMNYPAAGDDEFNTKRLKYFVNSSRLEPLKM